MKIGLQYGPISGCSNHSQHLAKVLTDHSADHQFTLDAEQFGDIDLYHSFTPRLPFGIAYRAIPVVLTLSDLHFLRRPKLYTPFERMITHRLFRSTIYSADRLITLNCQDRDHLVHLLNLPSKKIEVVMPLAAPLALPTPSQSLLQGVKDKYLLPDHFILMVGVVEPRHHHLRLLEAIMEADMDIGVVICGRRTAWSDHLLEFTRKHHMALRVEFIYEPSADDLSALYSLCDAFAYLPDEPLEASVAPVVEALRAGVPSILSDTPLNHEVAEDGALYLCDGSVAELCEALDRVLADGSERTKIVESARCRANYFSQHSLADQLLKIYNSI